MDKCDLTYLKSISAGNSDFIKKILELFLTDTQAAILEMQKNIELKDYASVHRYAHKIKPSVELLGLPKEVVELLFKINNTAKLEDENVNLLPEMVDTFDKKMQFVFSDLKDELKMYLS